MRVAALVGDGSQEECGRVPKGSGRIEVLCRSGMAYGRDSLGVWGFPKGAAWVRKVCQRGRGWRGDMTAHKRCHVDQ